MIERSHRPRKRFGQHFLHDPGVIQRIVAAIAPAPGQRLVEIGPGRGAMTRPLLQAAGELDVVELDRDLIDTLRAECAAHGTLRVHQGDALKFDFCALTEAGDQRDRLRVVGNLPYNISTPLLFHLMEQVHCIEDMCFMLQREVVQRMVATPGSNGYGRLSVMIQYYCQAEQLFTVAAGAFQPPPKVESAIVRLVPHARPPVEVHDVGALSQLVAQAFSQRRKTLRNALRGQVDTDTMIALGVDPTLRPERLTLAQFAALANATRQ
ncbi:MAG: 16S rRNA (adenine(1518)-N(6)/adenine(1519)-N(6))-dimethyltransferase RsmA [Pseudomonadota bacterium]|nr:MAG: 16S rRNA (adenine(1518)-N(6)/adenine(1519)-N(6))-dimethyltransferase RsmA [Pseudomonadota bacterium]